MPLSSKVRGPTIIILVKLDKFVLIKRTPARKVTSLQITIKSVH